MGSLSPPDARASQHALKTKSLEVEYEKSIRRVDAVCQRESARQLRYRTILLRNDNERLQHQASSGNGKSKVLEKDAQKMKQTIVQLEERLKTDSRSKSREIEDFKTEIAALEAAASNSTKILTEKLALSRELATLKPELDHLRSLSAVNQNLIAEKLSLEHQLSTLEVKLELEQRTTKRLSEKKNREAEQDVSLAEQIESLKKELSKEKRERQLAEKDSGKGQRESENRVSVLEGRVEALKTKLRTTKEQLKETKADLARSEAEVVRLSSAVEAEKPVKNVRKRKAAALDHDQTIGTPDGFGIRKGGPKRDKRPSTQPGEKSNFSITPFLSRTASLPPEESQHIVEERETSPEPERLNEVDEDAESEDEVPEVPEAPEADDLASIASETPSGRPRPKQTKKSTLSSESNNPPPALVPAKTSKTNARQRKTTLSTLEAVPEEGDAENAEAIPIFQPTLPPQQLTKSVTLDPIKTAQPPEQKAKKRKLLGAGKKKTLFDDEDDEIGKSDRPVFAGAKSLASLTKAGAGGSKARVIGTSAGGFGQFSPRKKEKKALNRSILQ